MSQKRAWKVYAEKRKLRYKSISLMGGPELNGVIDEHTVGVFTSEHVSQDARGVRKLTAIEVNLNSVMPVSGGVASGGMIPIMKGLRFKQEYLPKHPSWKKSYVASASNKHVLQCYLNDARVEALSKLMEIPNSWVILIFKDDVMLLRIDLADPLHDPKRLDKRVKAMLNAAEVLELVQGEAARLKKEQVKASAKAIELEIDDDVLGDSLNLSLEDEALSDDSDAKAEAAASEDVPPEVAKPEDEKSDKKKAKGDKPSASSKSSKKK